MAIYIKKIVFILILLTSYSSGQDIQYNVPLSVVYETMRYKTASGVWAYSYGPHDIGRLNGSNGINPYSDDDRFRIVFGFNLAGLDDDIVIKSARLYLTIADYEESAKDYQATVRHYTKDAFSQSTENIWKNAATEPILFSGIKYSDASFKDLSNSALSSAVQSKLSADIVYFSVVSQNEETNKSQAEIFLSLEITYRPKISLIVKNSFNGGVVYWVTASRNVNHGETLRIEQGSNQTFQSNIQTYMGKEYIPLDTWLINGEIFTGNPITHTFNNNSTIIAQYAEKVTITVSNRNNGGSVKVDGETYASGTSFEFLKSSQHDFESWEQDFGSYYNVFKPGWHKWDLAGDQKSTALVEDYAVENTGTYRAQLFRRFNFNLDADFIHGGEGELKINCPVLTSCLQIS